MSSSSSGSSSILHTISSTTVHINSSNGYSTMLNINSSNRNSSIVHTISSASSIIIILTNSRSSVTRYSRGPATQFLLILKLIF